MARVGSQGAGGRADIDGGGVREEGRMPRGGKDAGGEKDA